MIRRQAFATLVAAVLAVGLLVLGARPALAQGAAAPPGSYLQTCSGIKYSGSILSAGCPDHAPSHSVISGDEFVGLNSTSLDVSACDPKADISNNKGYLYCTAKIGKANARAVPWGSYMQSCDLPYVQNGLLMAKCDGKQTSLSLAQCDLTKGIDNISGQLICAPGAQAAATPKAQAATVASVLKGAGCDLFLGRPTEFLCSSDAGFAKCKAMMPSPQVTACHAPGQLSTDCSHFLGRPTEYLCSTEASYQQCRSFEAAGKATACHGKGHLPEQCVYVPGTANTYVCSTSLSLGACQAVKKSGEAIQGKPVSDCVQKQ